MKTSIRPAIFATALAARLFVLVLESQPKAEAGAILLEDVSLEENAGIFSRSFMLWVNPLLAEGYNKNLAMEDMHPIDSSLSPDKLYSQVSRVWKTGTPRFLSLKFVS